MAHLDDIRRFLGGGLDNDSAYEDVAPNDYLSLINARNTGTSAQEEGYITDLESNILVAGMLAAGFNQVCGGAAFTDINAAILFRYNSAGNNQILYYDYIANTITVIYTDLTNSGGVALLPLNPRDWVNCILVDNTYGIWTSKSLEVGYTNLNTLRAGGYGTVLWEDISLLKPQCMVPPTGTYGSDTGKPANFWFGVLPQAIVQYVNSDFNFSAWSTRSKRITPFQQNTPSLGNDVSQNNYIIWSFDIGSARAATLNFAIQLDDTGQFYQIKSVDRSYVLALPNTAVNVATEIYEAYNPATNQYSFVDYNNTIKIPVDTTETDLLYDYIWPSNTSELVNGNIAAIADWTIPYSRLTVPVTIAGVGYNPNIAIPSGSRTNPLRAAGYFPGASGSGAGNHRRIISITLAGNPITGDQILVTTSDIRNASNTEQYNYTVPSGLSGNLAGVVAAYTPFFPNSSYKANGDGTYTITWTDNPYFGLTSFNVQLFYAGATVSNSIPSVLDNTVYQMALSVRDKQGRFFPLITDNTYQFKTPSYAQVNGQAIEISATIGAVTLPAAAFDAQWVITKPVPTKVLDTMAVMLNYKGTWNAVSNTPTLAPNTGTVGDTYQITTPALPTNAAGSYHDLGTSEAYPTGGYVTYNGKAWNVLPASFGDLTSTGNIMAFSLNPLRIFNDTYSKSGVNTILAYSFAAGDRLTMHYYINSGTNTFFNSPCIDVSVLGYDPATYIVKAEKSVALVYSSPNVSYNGTNINSDNIFLRLYSPGLNNQTSSSVSNSQVWYEIGERFTITNGVFDKTQFFITDGGVYYKTRLFDDGPGPYSNNPNQTLATDFNYSDFYVSAFWSKGRPRTFYDVLENTEQKASIITSQNYILGSRNNGLNRFYPSLIYGEGDGQTSSSFGAIQFMWMRGRELVIGQERNIFYIPVNETYTVVNAETTGESLSFKLLNNGRYSPRNIGCSTLKASFTKRYDNGWFVDPQNSQPMQIGLDGVLPISGKMSKYFKSTLGIAYQAGKRIMQYFDDYYEEMNTCIQSASEIITSFGFDDAGWSTQDSFTIAPAGITANNGTHSTVSYNSTTGIATYTPATNYVGGDTATFSFNPGTGIITKNVCLNWTAGSGSVNPFVFSPLTGVPVSTIEESNTIGVNGNDYPVAISITGDPGAAYSINGGAFTSAPGTVNAGDNVQVQVMSSASNSTSTSATLTVDGQSGTFTVTTVASGGGSTISINNTTTDFTMAYVKVLLSGTTVYSRTTIGPGGSFSDPIAPGTTYQVAVKILTSTDGRTGTLKISSNGTVTTYSVPSFGLTITQNSVSTPIIVELDP